MHDFDLAILLLPLVVVLGGLMMLSDKSGFLRVLLSLVGALIAAVFAFVLICTVGVSIHFSIGGTL